MSKITVFISYAREDVEKVKRIRNRLAEAGMRPWLDIDQILPGEKWDKKIKEGLEQADFIILCLSNNSVSKRGYLQKEIRYALNAVEEMLDSDIYLVPIRLDACEVPRSLQDFQWVDYFSLEGPEKLLMAIREGAKKRELGGAQIEITKKDDSQTVDLSHLGGSDFLKSFSLKKIFKRDK